MALDKPVAVVSIFERQERLTQVLDRGERLDPEELLLERADEALGAAVALRLAHERGAAADAQEAQLGLVGVAQELGAVVVAQRQADGDALAVVAEVLADAPGAAARGLQ